MKKTIFLFLLSAITVLTACESSLKALRRGDYADAIRISLNKVQKDTENQKEIPILEEAYTKLYEKDLSVISNLKKTGNPDIWDHVYNILTALQRRQDAIKALPPLHILNPDHMVVFPMKDLDDEIIDARQKAAAYHYAHASALLEKGGRTNAKDAYAEFLLVKNYFSEYKDLDQMLKNAREAGTAHVLLSIENLSGTSLPAHFQEDLFAFNIAELDNKWTKFHLQATTGYKYDFQAQIHISRIDVSPELVKESHFPRTADIEDGWTYKLDKNGNVLKDANGNDIKVINMIRVSCDYMETIQRKSLKISGNLDIQESPSGQNMRSIPLASEVFFEYPSAAVAGDFRALEPGIRKNLRPPVPFPNNSELLLQAAGTMKISVKQMIKDNLEIFN